MLEGMVAWNSDFHYLYVDVAGTGLLPVEAERQGKIVVTTELGGGGLVTRDVHELSSRGLANVLRHAGVLEGEVETRASMGLPDAVILDGRDPRNYVFAPTSGIFETLVDVGQSVTAGAAGRPHLLARAPRARARRPWRRRSTRSSSASARSRGRSRATASSSSASRSRRPTCFESSFPLRRPGMSVLEVMGTRTFASVRKHRNFRLYFSGQAVSFTGYWMQQIAAAWLLLELTDSPVAVGALALAHAAADDGARPLRRHGDRPLRRPPDDDRLRGARRG